MFLCLIRPLGDEGIKEELAWKYTDLARCVGYFNLLPILGLDGSGIYSNLVHSLGIHLGGSLDLIVRIGLVVLIVLTSGTYKIYRKLL